MTDLSVLLIDTEPNTNNFYITLAVQAALRANPRVQRVVLAHHGNALALMQSERLNTVLAFGGAARHHAILQRLCALADVSVLWTTEDPYERKSNILLSRCFDLIFTNDRSSVPAYGGRAIHLPLAASRLFQDFDVRRDDRDYRYDILFVGTAWPNRIETINRILVSFSSDLKVKIALPWNEYLERPFLVRKDIIIDWRCGNVDFARLANSSRVVLTLPRAFSASAVDHAVGSTPPPRLFEVALAGGCQLVVSGEPEITDYYGDNEEIKTCADDTQIADDIRELIENPTHRIQLAKRARERTIEHHLYDHRVETIVENILAVKDEASARSRRGASAKPRILFLSHNRIGKRRQTGGIEFYQEHLAKALDAFEVCFLYPALEDGGWTLRLDDEEGSEVIPIPSAQQLLVSAEIEGHFERILVQKRIDLVHVHHLLNLPLSLPLIARACGVPVVVQVHDFYLICSRFNLLNQRGTFCDVVHRGHDQCDGCLMTADSIAVGSKARRDGFIARMLRSVDAFVASTPYSINYLQAFYPEIAAARVALVEMIDSDVHTDGAKPPSRFRDNDILHIAVLGNVVDHKGAQTLIELIQLCEGQNYRFDIFGYVETYLVERLNAVAGSQVRLHRGYKQHQVPDLLRDIDVSLHLSVWPETYMIALTEAWRAGAVPIVTNLGAPNERVTDGVDGLKVPPHDAGAVLQALRRLRYDRPLMLRIRQAIAGKSFPRLADHARQMADLYQDLMRLRPIPRDTRAVASPAYNISSFDIGLRLNSPEWTSTDHLWDQSNTSIHRASEMLDALPLEANALPFHAAKPEDAHLFWELHEVEIDGQKLSGNIGAYAVANKINIAGFMWDARCGPAQQTLLRLRSANNRDTFVVTQTSERPDLVLRFQNGNAGNVGFLASISAAALSAGAYTIDILQVFPDRILEAVDVLRFVAAGFAKPHILTLWSQGQPEVAAQWQSSPGVATLEAHSLQLIAGLLVLRQGGSTFRAVVRLPASASTTEHVALLLQSEGRDSYWAEGEWLSDEADGFGRRFEIATRVHGLDPGRYKLQVACYGDSALVYDSDVVVHVTTGSQAYAVAAQEPPIFKLRSLMWAFKRLHIDQVRVIESATGAAKVSVRGWCFSRQQGSPLYCAAIWHEKTGGQFFVVEAARRKDVAVSFKTTAAFFTGFEVEAPLSRFVDEEVIFRQAYPKGTLQDRRFSTRVIAKLDELHGYRYSPDTNHDLRLGRSLLSKVCAALARGLGMQRLWRQYEIITSSGAFSSKWYRARLRRRLRINPVADYLLLGREEGYQPHPLFDAKWYTTHYQDVDASHESPFVHYLTQGRYEGRDTGPLFLCGWYVDQHPEIATSRLTPLSFYDNVGEPVGHATTPIFDAAWYVKQDGLSSVTPITAFKHFIETGFAEALNPSPFFRTVRPDALVDPEGASGSTPFRHWLTPDIQEVDAKPFDPDWYHRMYSDNRSFAGDSRVDFAKRGRAAGCLGFDPTKALSGARIAVIAHLFYEDLWSELSAAIKRIPIAFDLYVTAPKERAQSLGALVLKTFPSARILPTEVQGRDIGPFFEAFQVATSTATYLAICKVHTKKGRTHPDLWRALLMDSVIGSSALICDIVKSFLDNPKLAIVGSRDLYFSGLLCMEQNEANLRRLLHTLSPGAQFPSHWGFFAGTMFWLRPALFADLARAVADHIEFELDNSKDDGQAAHALERLFGLLVSVGGYDVGLVEPLPRGPVPHIVKISAQPVQPNEERPERYLDRKAAEIQRLET